jgi:putative flippase GtrA
MTDYAFARVVRGVCSPTNYVQLAKFATVGAIGYAVNLAVYGALLQRAGLHYLLAAIASFLIAVTSNYVCNRNWTFRAERGHIAHQGMRFFVVSVLALSANLVFLHALVTVGASELPAQAAAVALAMPLSFVGHKIWSFSPR